MAAPPTAWRRRKCSTRSMPAMNSAPLAVQTASIMTTRIPSPMKTADNGRRTNLVDEVHGRLPGGARQLPGLPYGTAGAVWRTSTTGKNVASRTACGSCHDNINWTTGAKPCGGVATNDDNCYVCHPSSGVGFGQSVTDAHKWTTKDIRNIPEFDVTLTMDTRPGYYIKGKNRCSPSC